MNNLYLISANAPDEDFCLDLVVVAISPECAFSLWSGYYADTLEDFEFYPPLNRPSSSLAEDLHLLGEDDIRIYQIHFDLEKPGAINWNDRSGMQLVAGVALS